MAIAATGTATDTTGVGMEDFLKILISQLGNQDPLKPMDNQEFVTQIAQFSALEQSRQLNEKIDQLLSAQAATQSVGLLGRTVDVGSVSGMATGRVTALTFAAGEPMMTVLTSAGATIEGVSLSQLLAVR